MNRISHISPISRIRQIKKRFKPHKKAVLIISLIAILILAPLAYLTIIAPEETAAWFDDSYAYRQQVTFTHNADISDERRITFSLDTAELITAGVMQSDCDDTRFTDINGKVLRFELTGTCNNAATTYEVVMPSIINGTNTFYVYYGNSSAVSASEDVQSVTALTPSGGDPAVTDRTNEEQGPAPVMYLKFDEGHGQTMEDQTSNNNDGTRGLTSSSESSDPAIQTEDLCVSGKCLFFDGSDDEVKVPDDATISSLDTLTVSAWIRINSINASDQMTIVGHYSDTSGNREFQMLIETDGTLHMTDGQGNSAQTSYALDTGRWYHVAGTFDNNGDPAEQQKIYVNGKLEDVGPGRDDSRDSDKPLTIGAREGSTDDQFFHGFIDEVKVYNHIRSADEIRSDFIQGAAHHGSAAVFGRDDQAFLSDGLVGYWDMPEATGSATLDKSGNSNDGTLTNMQETGIADTGSTTTTVVDADGSLSGTDDAYNDMIVEITDGSCGISSGTSRTISDYTGSTNTITVSSAFGSEPDDCGYIIKHQIGGKFGNALNFDGTDDYVNIPDDPSLDFGTGDTTFSAWIKSTQDCASDWKIYVSKYSGSAAHIFRCEDNGSVGNASLYVRDSDGVTQTVAGTSNITDGSWHHIVGIKKGYPNAKLQIFVDGVLENEEDASYTGNFDNNSAINIGRLGNNSRYADAKIDEVRIYNRALSPAEVSALYDWAPGPVGHWKLDENTGTIANDSSGNGNTGTLGGDGAGSNVPGWVSGKVGQALDFDGDDDGVEVPSDSTLEISNTITLSAWVYLHSDNASGRKVICKHWCGSSSDTEYILEIEPGAAAFTLNISGTVTVTGDEVPLNEWHHIAGTYDGSTMKVYNNGVETGSSSQTGSIFTSTDPLVIGNSGSNSGLGTDSDRNFDGLIDSARIYNYVRTPQQIIEDMNAGHPAPGSPVSSAHFHFKLDSGSGVDGYDVGLEGQNLTLNTDEAWTADGKFGSALKARGSNYAFFNNHSSTEFTSTESFTLSLWFRSQSASNPASDEYILDMQDGTGYAIYTNTSGNAVFGIDTDGTWTPQDTATSTTDVYDGNWHHIAAKKTGTDKIEIFVDSKLEGSDTSLSATGNLENNARFVLGAQDVSLTSAFDGDIDEVSLFRTGLTADQVKILYNQGFSQVMGSTSTDSSGNATWSAAKEYCPPGNTDTCDTPMNHWTFDENTGQSAFSKVTNDNNLNYELSRGGSQTEQTSDPAWIPGKIGAALEFDGSDDYIARTGDPQGLDFVDGDDFSLEAWIWRDTSDTEDAIIDKKGILGTSAGYSFYIDDSNDNIVLQVADGTDTYSVESTSTITSPGWNHVVVTFDESDESNIKIYLNGRDDTGTKTGTLADIGSLDNNRSFSVGRRDANPNDYFDGKIDNVIVYKYVRTQAQASWQYNRGRPVGWWRLDDNVSGDAQTIRDASGNQSDGTTENGGNGTGMDCTVDGKRNLACDFDNTDDRIDVTTASELDDMTEYSIAGWINPGSRGEGNFGRIIRKGNTGGTPTGANMYWSVHMDGTSSEGKLSFRAGFATSACVAVTNEGTVPFNQWSHFAVTYTHNTSSQPTFYINGRESPRSADCTPIGSLNSDDSTLAIGDWGDGNRVFDGKIDDLRVFNYILTEQQVREVMGEGAVRFGPSEGSP